MAKFIRLDDSNIVKVVRIGTTILPGEIETKAGELGQLYDPATKTFSAAPVAPEPPVDVPALLLQIKANQDTIIAAQARIETALGGTVKEI